MIRGTGVDIVEIARIRRAIERSGEHFLARVFTVSEQAKAKSLADSAPYFASRWAVKEAFSKALGCGIGEKISFLDIETIKSATGVPQIKLSPRAQEYVAALEIAHWHLSISHEQEYAVAMVIVE